MLIGQVEELLKDDNFKMDDKIFNFSAVCGGELPISLKIFRIINKSSRDFLNNILEKDFQDVMINKKGEINNSILICLLESLHPTS
jgi:hypothetical protein